MANLTLTPGADIATFGPEKSFITGLVENLTSIDQITFGDGGVDDVVILTSAGTVDFRAGGNASGVTRFERLDLAAGTNSVFITDALVSAAYFGAASAGFFSVRGATGNDTIDASLVTSAGNRVQFVLGGGGDDTFIGSNGADVLRINANELTAADSLNAGASTSDVLRFDTAGAVDAGGFTNVRRVERVELNAGGNAITVTQAFAASAEGGRLLVFSGGGNNTIDAQAATTTVQYSTGAGIEQFLGGGGADIIVANTSTIAGSDALNGGSGSAIDVLQLAGGTYAAAQLAGVTQIERIQLLAPGSVVNLALGLAATSTGTFAVIGTAGNDQVTTPAAETARVGFNPGSGTDRFTGGGGDDQINIAIADLDSADQFDGGAGRDRIGFTTAGTITAAQLSGLTSIETLSLSSAGPNTVTLGTNLTTVNVAGGTGNDTVTMALSTQFASLGAGDDTMIVSATAVPGDTSYGKEGFDTIRTTGAGTFTIGAGIVEFEALVMQDAATLDLTNTTMALTVTGSGGNDSITLGAVGQTVNAGGGNDTVVNGNGNDTLDGGAGFDTFILGPGGGSFNLGITGPQDTGQGLDTVINFEAVLGGTGGDTITGDNNPNTLSGAAGNDIIIGLGGNDLLSGGAGNDTLNGGADSDTADYIGAAAGIVVTMDSGAPQVTNDGDGGQDTLVAIENINGSNLVDAVTGDGANNILSGNGGNDTIVGGGGDDTIEGGAGDDDLQGSGGTDTVTYVNAAAAVTVLLTINGAQGTGGAGTDTLKNFENLTGSGFNDTLFGDAGVNVIRGGAGNDYMQGGGGADQLFGDAGNDTIEDSDGFNLLRGGDGDDVANLTFGSGSAPASATSWVQMGNGADQINFTFNNTTLGANRAISTGSNTTGAGTSPDNVEAGDGNDQVNVSGTFNASSSYVLTMSGDDQVSMNTSSVFAFVHLGAGNDQYNGNNGNDVAYGGAGNDRLFGNNGNDTFDGGLGDDEINGGDGVDTASYSATATSATAGVTVDLALFAAQSTGGAGTDTLFNIENLVGTGFADTLAGNSGANALNGGAGDDLLVGRLGADTLIGGTGNDEFRWFASNEGGDLIEKFTAGGTEDSFDFLATAFALFNGQGAIQINNDTSSGGSLAAGVDVVTRTASGLTAASAVDSYLAGAAGTFAGGVFVLAQGGNGQTVQLFYDPNAAATAGSNVAMLLATLVGVNSTTGFSSADFGFF
jgi:Ca2+-binding RTX toxin-like protein